MTATSGDNPKLFGRAAMMGRIGHLVVSGFLIAAANIFGSSLAAARFLSAQGGGAIASYYVVFALISIPAWLVYSRLIDRHNRARLLQIYLATMSVLTLLLAAFSMSGGSVADYALYGGISVLEQLLFSLYMVALADYLTAREMTRFSTWITVSHSAGAMTGGFMAGLLSHVVSPAWLLFGMPLMLLGSLAHFSWVTRRWPPAGEWAAVSEGSILDGLRGMGRILRSVTLAALLAAAVFLNIVTQCVSEYMVFSIYTDNFPGEQEMANFFGMMSGVLNLAAILIGFGITGPLMSRLGVARMNLLFPASLGLSFVAMVLNPVLGVAVIAHIVYDGFSNNVDAPVMAVNYNAIPARQQGQVRVFNDSLIYPVALAVSGLLIWVADQSAGFTGVGVLGLATSAAFIAVGWHLGRGYLKGLVGILRDGSLDLGQDDFIVRQAPLVAERQRDSLQAMLASDDPVAADTALRIIARADLWPFLPGIRRWLIQGGSPAIGILARAGDRHARALLSLWPEADEMLRLRIAEYLAVVGLPLPPDATGTPVMDALALASAGDVSPEAVAKLTALARDSLPVAEVLLPVAAARRHSAFVPLLVAIAQAHPDLELEALRSLGEFPPTAMRAASIPDELISSAVASAQANKRVEGYRLAAVAGWPVARIAPGLADQDMPVRRAAIAALPGSPSSIEFIRPLLHSEMTQTRLAAIEALGNAGATDELLRYLQDVAFPRIAEFRDWRPALRNGAAPWIELARIAMDELDAAAIDEVLQTLVALGHGETVRYIRRFIAARDTRMRARAAEAISAFDERKLVLPLLPLLDAASPGGAEGVPVATVLHLMKSSASPWLRRAAALSDAKESTMSVEEQGLLERLLFLRRVPVFEGCTLDDLHAIHLAMTRTDHQDGERIIEEGQQGEELYVLLAGEVKVGRTSPRGFVEYSRLKAGSAFGEMALFGDGVRSADVVAVGRATCLALDRSHFDDLLRQRPDILRQICRLFAGRMQEANRGMDRLQAAEPA